MAWLDFGLLLEGRTFSLLVECKWEKYAQKDYAESGKWSSSIPYMRRPYNRATKRPIRLITIQKTSRK